MVTIVVVVIARCDGCPRRRSDTGSDYRSVLASHFGANRAAQCATDRATDGSVFDQIVGPACCCERAADREQ